MSFTTVQVSEMYAVFSAVIFISKLTKFSFVMFLDAAGLLHRVHMLQHTVTAGALRDTL
jgi:hypothetical protein